MWCQFSKLLWHSVRDNKPFRVFGPFPAPHFKTVKFTYHTHHLCLIHEATTPHATSRSMCGIEKYKRQERDNLRQSFVCAFSAPLSFRSKSADPPKQVNPIFSHISWAEGPTLFQTPHLSTLWMLLWLSRPEVLLEPHISLAIRWFKKERHTKSLGLNPNQPFSSFSKVGWASFEN